MQIRISSPKHFESVYGSSPLVRAYLDQIEKTVGSALASEAIDILRISLLIAHPEELAQGKFLEYNQFDWRCRYVAIGVNGNFERYYSGDDQEKICELSNMLQVAFKRISQKKRAAFDYKLASECVLRSTQVFLGNTGDVFRNDLRQGTEMRPELTQETDHP